VLTFFNLYNRTLRLIVRPFYEYVIKKSGKSPAITKLKFNISQSNHKGTWSSIYI